MNESGIGRAVALHRTYDLRAARGWSGTRAIRQLSPRETPYLPGPLPRGIKHGPHDAQLVQTAGQRVLPGPSLATQRWRNSGLAGFYDHMREPKVTPGNFVAGRTKSGCTNSRFGHGTPPFTDSKFR